jgi:XTP/dITP diphosphohydrolase
MQLVIATSSEHKRSEIAALLSEIPNLKVLSLRDFSPIDEPDENGASMRENARLKAEYYAQITKLSTLADDSGIEVSILDDAPGVYSARWIGGSDGDRTLALLERMQNVSAENRAARYRCALCFVDATQSTLAQSTLIELEANCEGRIAQQARGENGFGYDPIFELTTQSGAPNEYLGKTMAEVGPEIKALISHRARAVRMLAERLKSR